MTLSTFLTLQLAKIKSTSSPHTTGPKRPDLTSLDDKKGN